MAILAAAMRYTEIRMKPDSIHCWQILIRETVDFVPNWRWYRADSKFCLPVPNFWLTVFRYYGGMATNIPTAQPDRKRSVAALALIDNEDITIDELMEFNNLTFPTAAIINGGGYFAGSPYGRGRIYVRAKADVVINENRPRNNYHH